MSPREPTAALADSALPEDMEFERILAQSSRSTVILVRRDGERFVLKIGPSSKSLAPELVSFSRVDAPALVPPRQWGRTPDGRAYLLRDFVPGHDLAEGIRAATSERVVSWTQRLLDTLGALHDSGLVHGDVKASNVIVDGEDLHLIDLDLAGHLGEGSLQGGTRFHVAPEVLLGQPCRLAADLFSLGATLAYALCGSPFPDFHARFPQQDFWTAAGLAPDGLPEELALLVRSLVRRNPTDRPESARSARALLVQAGEHAPRSRRLPPLAGRDAAIERMASALTSEPTALLVGAQDESELEWIRNELHMRATIAGLTVTLDDSSVVHSSSHEERPIQLFVVREVGERALLALRGALASKVGRVALICPEGVAVQLYELVRAELLDEDDARLVSERFPLVSVSTLEEHLSRISDRSAPKAAQSLARSLHTRSEGRIAEINRALDEAEEAGVLRRQGASYVLLEDEWPATRSASHRHRQIVLSLAAPARRILSAAALLGERLERSTLAEVADASPEEAAEGFDTLYRQGIFEAGVDREARVLVADRRWQTAALEETEPEERRELRLRAARRLRELGAPPREVLAIELELAASVGELEELLAHAERQREVGDLALARTLARGVLERAEGHPEEIGDRACVLLSRLESGRGAAAEAAAILERRHGKELVDCAPTTLLAAAEAAELGGRRTVARGLYERVLDAEPRSDERLRAVLGIAYGLHLDGSPHAALERTHGLPRPKDPDEAAGALLNLQAGALTDLQRFDEASHRLDAARGRAESSGDPTLLGKTELNRAYLARRRGELEAALAALERAGRAFAQANHLKLRALCENNIGVLLRDLGRLREARERVEGSLSLRRRIGDAFGTAVSTGNLGIIALEAGQVGAALTWLARGRILLERGGYETELSLVDAHEAMAFAQSGRIREARALLKGPRFEALNESKPLLAARCSALLELCAGHRERALPPLRRALSAPSSSAPDLAERYRVARTWLAIDPNDGTAREALLSSSRSMASPTRRTEWEWLTRDLESPANAALLQSWLEEFEQTGRTDLVRAVALRLAGVLNDSGKLRERRESMARATSATDAITDGLSDEERGRALRSVDLLACSEESHPRKDAIGVDWFLTWNRRMASEQDLEELLYSTVDMALVVSGARCGFLVLLDGSEVETQVARGITEEDRPAEELRFSRTVVKEAIRSGAPVVTGDVTGDERFVTAKSIESLELRSILCVPLPHMEGLDGAIYVDNVASEAVFDEFDAQALRTLADQAAIAIVHLRRQETIHELNGRLRESLSFREEELSQMRSLLRHEGSVPPVGRLIGESTAMQELHRRIARFGPTDLPVLLTGPGGGDLRAVARALHEHSGRAEAPFLSLNLSTLTPDLIEEELFGRSKQDYEAQGRNQLGILTKARQGTVFLEAVEDLPPGVQVKLLAALETGTLRPVGSRKQRPCQVRVVASSNADLHDLVRKGSFDAGLFHLLDTVDVPVPPIADRPGDVPLIAAAFLDELNARNGTAKTISPPVLEALVKRPWPGDLRELSNEVSRLYYSSDEVIGDPERVRGSEGPTSTTDVMPASFRLEDVERAAISRALEATGQNKERAAKLLGISRAGLYKKLERLTLHKRAR